MASLQKSVPIKARESVLAAAAATISARQRVSVDWSEASNAIKTIESVPAMLLNEKQKEIATDLLIHAHTQENVNLDSVLVIRQLNAWMNSWLEHSEYRNIVWEDVIQKLDQVVRTEFMSELSHLDDFVGYLTLNQVDDDLHFAINRLKICA